ncbi:MAG: hypothetical protein WCH75_04600 [Candidatus Binatia bacterium]
MLSLLLLIRFLCFVAIVYLSLHVMFTRLISRPDSKVLWFFSIITSPLTWPVRVWLFPQASESQIRFAALFVYGLLWVLVVVLMNLAVPKPA